MIFITAFVVNGRRVPIRGLLGWFGAKQTLILQTENDILLRAELEDIAKRHPEQFVLWYTLDRPPKGRDTWKCLWSSLYNRGSLLLKGTSE